MCLLDGVPNGDLDGVGRHPGLVRLVPFADALKLLRCLPGEPGQKLLPLLGPRPEVVQVLATAGPLSLVLHVEVIERLLSLGLGAPRPGKGLLGEHEPPGDPDPWSSALPCTPGRLDLLPSRQADGVVGAQVLLDDDLQKALGLLPACLEVLSRGQLILLGPLNACWPLRCETMTSIANRVAIAMLTVAACRFLHWRFASPGAAHNGGGLLLGLLGRSRKAAADDHREAVVASVCRGRCCTEAAGSGGRLLAWRGLCRRTRAACW